MSEHDWKRRAAKQRGLASVRQLNESGVTDRRRRRARHDGYLDKVGAHTYRSSSAAATAEDDLAALVFDCGPNAWASGPTAAALHEFDGFRLRAPFHVTVLRGRNIRRIGHHVHTVSRLDQIDRSFVRGIAVYSPARTIVDLARMRTDLKSITAAIDSMIRDRGGTEEFLMRRLGQLAGHGAHGVRQTLAALSGMDASRGGHSFLERRFLELIADAGLPHPVTQHKVVNPAGGHFRVDCRFPGTNVIVELLGYSFHWTERQLSSNARRMNELVQQGYQPLQFTFRQVMEEPDRVIDQLRRLLHTAA